MASFGGQTPVNSPASITNSALGGTVYTVPAGRYAEVILHFQYGSGGSVTVGGFVYLNVGIQELKYKLSSGESISLNPGAGSNSLHIGIVEFNNP